MEEQEHAETNVPLVYYVLSRQEYAGLYDHGQVTKESIVSIGK